MYKTKVITIKRIGIVLLIIAFFISGIFIVKSILNKKDEDSIKHAEGVLNSTESTPKVEEIDTIVDSTVVDQVDDPVEPVIEDVVDPVEEVLKVELDKKIAYLTFDDGPSKKVTPQILDILKEYDIKATFFVLGKMANENSEILQRVHEEGHAIGHHSYTHVYAQIYKNVDNFLNEIEQTNQTFKRILGEDFATDLLRFPGGSFEPYKQKYILAVQELGYKTLDWNSLNGDSEGIPLTKENLVNRFKVTSRGKDHLVVLMHDIDSKVATVEALPEIIQYLIDNGYEFRTLYEMSPEDTLIKRVDPDEVNKPKPKPTTPSTQTPSTQTPSTQTPSTQTPSTQTPSTQTPSTQTPSTQTPSTQTPSTEEPSTEEPSTEVPEPTKEEPTTEVPVIEVP